ncbi:hypothetical protein MRX96_034781 [Rhipicephalus microplus]
MAGRSCNRDVQLGYEWWSGNLQILHAFMLFAQDERLSTAADNTCGDNRRVNGRLGKLWNSVSAATKDTSCERNVTKAATDQRKKCADNVCELREANRDQESQRKGNDAAINMKNSSSGSSEKQHDNAMAALQGRRTKEMQRHRHWLP